MLSTDEDSNVTPSSSAENPLGNSLDEEQHEAQLLPVLVPRLPMINIGSQMVWHRAAPFVGVAFGVGNAWSRLASLEIEASMQQEIEDLGLERTPLEILCKLHQLATVG